MKLEFDVNNKHMGKIFGRKGINLKNLTKNNGVKINISKDIVDDFRKITLKHFFSMEKLVKVKLEILIMCNDNQYTLDFYNLNLNKERCSICLDFIDKNKKFCVTECSHKFHTDCLMKCINIKNTCPLCRKELKEFSGRKVLSEEKIDELIYDTIDTGLRNNLFNEVTIYFMGLDYPNYIIDFLRGPLRYILERARIYLEN